MTKRTQSDEFLRDKVFKIGSDPKYDWYQRGLASMVYKFFDKKSTVSGIKSMSNKKIADELQQPIISKFKRRRVYSSFKDNIWAVDLADMQLISKYNRGIRFLLWEIYLFIKYAWIVPERSKKELLLLMSILDKLKRKPNKIWIDQDSESYNNSFKNLLKENNIEMHSTYNEGNSGLAERFLKTLKNKIYKHITTMSKYVHFNVLDDIVDK